MRVHHTRLGYAFTLVELLIVIGIITVLIAILLPAISAARRQALLTHCLAVEREIASAANIHLVMHAGYYPIAGEIDGVPAFSVTGVTPESVRDTSRRKYMYTFIDIGSMKGLTLAPWHAAVASYMGKRTALDGGSNAEIAEEEIGTRSYLKYFLCPAQQHTAGDLRESLIYTGGNLGWMVQQSYVINEAVFGVNDKLGRLRGKASRIRRPAVTMMLADGLQSRPRGSATFADSSMGWMSFVNLVASPQLTLADALQENGRVSDARSFDRVRHRERINVMFFDGHAETLRITPADLRNAAILAQ